MLGVLISAICENVFLVSSCLKNYRNHNQNTAVKLYVIVYVIVIVMAKTKQIWIRIPIFQTN